MRSTGTTCRPVSNMRLPIDGEGRARRFRKAVSERFGERTLLPLAAKDYNGQTFNAVTSGMDGRTKGPRCNRHGIRCGRVQQLAAHERTTEALKQAETLRQTKSQGLYLKCRRKCVDVRWDVLSDRMPSCSW